MGLRLVLFASIFTLFTISFFSHVITQTHTHHDFFKFSPFPSDSLRVFSIFGPCRGPLRFLQDGQQVPAHDMAQPAIRCQHVTAPHHRVHPQEQQVRDHNDTQVMVGLNVGSDPLWPRLQRQVLMPHRRLWFRDAAVRWLWAKPQWWFGAQGTAVATPSFFLFSFSFYIYII